MKKFIVQAVFLLIVIVLALAIYGSRITNIPFTPQPPTTGEVIINNARFTVEIADTPEKRRKGLSEKDSLAEDGGMLFIFEKEDKYPFWMKGVKFPIDFVWIKGNTVVDFLRDIQPPAPNQSDQTLPIYASKEPVDKVLEVKAGTVDRLNIKTGDQVQIINK